MSAEYSVDGILAVAEAADNGDVRHPGMVADMLREFARIKAAQPIHHHSPDAADSGRVDAPRFFIDHTMIHDRVTGKHVTCDPDFRDYVINPGETTRINNPDGISNTCALLNGLAALAAQPQSAASPVWVPDGDAALLDALQHNSWDLRCFDHTDGEDIGWRVIEHYQAEPRERVIAEVFEDNPRYAIKQALLAAAQSATPEGGEVGL